MKKRFINRTVSQYKKLVFIGYMQEVLTALDKVTSDEAKQLVTKLRQCYSDYMAACNEQSTKDVTKVIQNDISSIDTYWTGLRTVAKGLVNNPIEGISTTASAVLDILNRYGYILNKSAKEKMAAVEFLVSYMDKIDQEKLEATGLTAFKTAMKAAFDEYQSQNLVRKALREANFEKTTKRRLEMEDSYEMLTAFIEAMAYTGSTEYDEFITLVNRIDVSRIKAAAEKAAETPSEAEKENAQEQAESSNPEQKADDSEASLDNQTETVG